MAETEEGQKQPDGKEDKPKRNISINMDGFIIPILIIAIAVYNIVALHYDSINLKTRSVCTEIEPKGE